MVIDIQQSGKLLELRIGEQATQSLFNGSAGAFAAVDDKVAVEAVMLRRDQAALPFLHLKKGDIDGWYGTKIMPVEMIYDIDPEQWLNKERCQRFFRYTGVFFRCFLLDNQVAVFRGTTTE